LELTIMININLEFLQECHIHGMKERIPYVWGMKPSVTVDTNRVKGSDCSGWIRYLFGRQHILIPEGSMEQYCYFRKEGYVEFTDYSRVENRHILYLCHASPTANEAGHIWLAYNQRTIECYGGYGVGSRDVMHNPLPRIFSNGFVIPFE
jgi:hypothetical protein